MGQPSDPDSQRRDHFRVVFPENKCPRLLIGGIFYSVIDISESGIRFRNPLHHKMPQDLFSANLHFGEKEIVKIVANVVRIEKDQVALHLVRGIPYKIILREQMEFMKK
ncbi:MAG TPA: PilZ domain-containing protein [Anaerolineaceae bacterium]|nr:PilZ domain-containing protein [Anaerolineaceae bacterium]